MKNGTWLGVFAACVLCIVPTFPHSAQWPPDQRVLISDFSYVEAVAATPWLVFAATRHGLVIYDRAAGRWRAPVTRVDGYPAQPVRRAAADPAASAVWLGLSGGGWVRYDVDARQWTPGTPPAEALASGLTVQQALARAPTADAQRALILTDARLRRYEFTAAAATPDRPDLFFGTNGMGLMRIDPQSGEWELLPFGLIVPGVGALAPTGEGVWAAASARPGSAGRRGLTWVAEDLSETRPAESGGATAGFSFHAARRMLTVPGALWIATERGVVRIDPRTLRAREYALPDASSLAPAPDGVWIGTAFGLSIVTRDGELGRVNAVEVPVLSLLAVGDTLWVGTTAGIGVLTPDEKILAVTGSPSVPIYALARVRDTVVAATDRGLLWRDGAGGWREVPVSLALGRPTSLGADFDRGLWIGGTQGLAWADLRSGLTRTLTVPIDLPAAVRDVLADGDYLWAATDSGLVRFDRRAALNR